MIIIFDIWLIFMFISLLSYRSKNVHNSFLVFLLFICLFFVQPEEYLLYVMVFIFFWHFYLFFWRKSAKGLKKSWGCPYPRKSARPCLCTSSWVHQYQNQQIFVDVYHLKLQINWSNTFTCSVKQTLSQQWTCIQSLQNEVYWKTKN